MDPTPKEFRPLLDELKKIREQLEELRQTINESEESHAKDRDIKPFWVDQVLAEYQEPVRDKQVESNRQYRVQNSLRWATWLAFIAAGFYGYMAVRQWREMISARHQAQEGITHATKAAGEAKRANDEAGARFREEERPYMVITQHPAFSRTLAANQIISVDVHFKNVGKTPAIQDLGNMRLYVYRIPDGDIGVRRKSYRQFMSNNIAELRKANEKARAEHDLPANAFWHGNDVAPDDISYASTQDPVSLNPADLSALLTATNDPRLILVLLSVETYRDTKSKVSEAPYETVTCRQFWGPNPDNWHRCDSLNIIQ